MSQIREAHRDPELAQHPKMVDRRDEAATSSKQQQKSVKKKECLGCPLEFDMDDKEGIYCHWEDVHRKYDEEENPNPSPSE